MAYLVKFWPKLIRYIERGDTPVDNNRCKNAIRPWCERFNTELDSQPGLRCFDLQ